MNPPRPQSGLLTTADAADYLGVHPKTLKRWVRAGKVIAVRSLGGSHYRFRSEDLEAFVAESLADPKTEASA